MDNISKPIIVVSKCLGFSSCRYNNVMISNKFIHRLQKYVEFITVCPEVEIGLRIPRDPIRVISNDENLELYQPTTGKYFTDPMNNFSQKFLNSLLTIDGFILKGRSPSCGKKDCKVYINSEKSNTFIKGSGFFAQAVINKYPYHPFEDEGRLTNARIREHFLTRIFTLSTFRNIKTDNNIEELIKFHSANKYLFIAYSQKDFNILEKVLENYNKNNFNEILEKYKYQLLILLNKIPRYTTNINALMHIFRCFSKKLSLKEKDFVLNTFENHKRGKIPLSVPLYLLKSYAIKYEEQHLLNQTIWCPYPEGLIEQSDSGEHEIFKTDD